MKEKFGTITKSKNSNTKKGKNNEDTSYIYNYSSSFHYKKKHINGFIEFLLVTKDFFVSIKDFIFKLISKLSFLMQSMIFKIPIIVIILIGLCTFHIYLFELLYFGNYYFAIKNEYLYKMTKKVDEKLLELDTLEFQSSFDEVEELLFFNIYFKELINMGLVDDNRTNNTEIFLPINSQTGSIYSSVNNINDRLGINNDYTISINDDDNIFLRSNSSLCELAKIYFYLLPSTTLEQIKQNKYLNQSFLIIYEYKNNLDKIEDENYFYFAYPKSNSIYINGNNFHPGNIKTNPQIFMSNKVNFNLTSKNERNFFDEENWFSKQDFLFRNNSNNINKSIISFEHLNYNHFGNINKTFITTLQSYIENNNKTYIINLINFFHQNNYTEDTKSYSIFLLNNNTDIYKPLIIEKYSNNDTFVISQYNITELSMSYILENYFHYGVKDIHNNYYDYGVSYDNFDLIKMSAPAIFYNTIVEFHSDVIFIATLFLFGRLFQLSNYNITKVEDEIIYEFYNEDKINEICNNFNFELYIKVIVDFKINCDNIDLYSNNTNNYYLNDYTDRIIPYCGCLALQCLNTSVYSIEEQYKSKNFILSKKLKLPNKCVNNFLFYEYKKSNEKIDLIKKIMNRFLYQEELNYITFNNIQLNSFPGISYLFSIAVDNTYLEDILRGLIYNLTITELYILGLILLWLITFLIVSILVTMYEAKRLTKLINNFNTKFDNYIYQLESSGLNDNTKNISENNNLSKSEKDSLLGHNISRTKSFKVFNSLFQSNSNYINSDNNVLLNELFNMFCEFYKLDPEKVIKKQQEITEDSRKEIKTNIMKEKNELFELFIKLCSYESKINLNLEYNLYIDNPLIKNFNNSLKNGKIKNPNEEKYTLDVIYELLSTENIYDEGLVSNLNFGYISYLYLNESKAIKNALFNKIINYDEKNFNIKQRLKDDQRRSLIKLILKNKNVLYDELQKYYDLDEIKFNKIESYFNQFLLSVYYKYIKKILDTKN